MGKENYYSYTSLSIYQRCPQQYKFNYLDCLTEIYKLPRPQFSLDVSVHNTISEFFASPPNAPDLKVLVELLNRNWISEGYSSPEEEMEYRQLALMLLENFYEFWLEEKSEKIFASEDCFRVRIASGDRRPFYLVGKIDRIDLIAGKNCAIVLYKTLENPPAQVDILAKDMQTQIYCLGVYYKYGLIPEKIIVYYLAARKKIVLPRSAEQINKITDTISLLVGKINNDKNFNARIGTYCSSCNYLTICPSIGLNLPAISGQPTKSEVQSYISRLSQLRNDLDSLHQQTYQISALLDYDLLVEKILDVFQDLSRVEKMALYVFDDYSGSFELARAVGFKTITQRFSYEEFQQNSFLKTKEMKQFRQITERAVLSFLWPGETNVEQGIVIPLIAQEQIVGLLVLANRKYFRRQFSGYELLLFQILSNQVATSLRNSRLYNLAISDGLTRLYIQRYFQQRLGEEMARSRRYNSPLSLLMLDIDGFKRINDTYGHQSGDEVLRNIARVIRTNIRETDIPARYGGEEFAIILPGTNLAGAQSLAEHLRQAVAEYPFMVGEKNEKITISIGVAEWDKKCAQSEFIRSSDEALYQAKRRGKNCVVLFSQ